MPREFSAAPYEGSVHQLAAELNVLTGEFPRYRDAAYKSLAYEEARLYQAYDYRWYPLVDVPRPDLGRWEDGTAHTYGEAISLAVKNDMFERDFRTPIAKGRNDARILLDASVMSIPIFRIAQAASLKSDEQRSPTESAAYALFNAAVSVFGDGVLHTEGERLFSSICEAARFRPLKSITTSVITKIIGVPAPISIGMSVMKFLTRPAYQLHKNVTGIPVYYNGTWKKITVDDGDFRKAYEAFAHVYNTDSSTTVYGYDGQKIILPTFQYNDRDTVEQMMKALAEAVYLAQPDKVFCVEDRGAAYMRWFNNWYRQKLFEAGKIKQI